MKVAAAYLRRCAFAPGESAVLAGIWRRAWASAQPGSIALEPIAHWHRRVQREFGPPGELLLVERAGQTLGFMLLQSARSYVAQLFVDAHLQRQGLGRMLLDEACVRMPHGWRLHVATDNVQARRFYARYGLVTGAVDRHPATGCPRVECRWRPGAA